MKNAPTEAAKKDNAVSQNPGPETEKQPSSDMKVCPKCGIPFNAFSKFCGGCGARN